MAITRTGVYVDDYLEYASTLPAELQRLLNTIRELDERSQLLIRNKVKRALYHYNLQVLKSHQLGLIDSHIKRHDKDLNNFAEDLKQGRERVWDRERDRDLEFMPPPGSHKKELAAPVDVDQPIDSNEPTY